ncbi:hypothetical protein ISCGN_007872 [Ixodes scapularis]
MASWPGTMGMSAFGIAGPLFGYLSERWSYNTVLVGCTILTSTGIMLCYFAPSVAFITFFYGVVHGGTLSGICIITNTITAQYFDRWRGTACGLGSCFQGISSFFMPDLANFILCKYGTPDLFLILGTLTLNVLPAALFLESPPWIASESSSQTSMVERDTATHELSPKRTSTSTLYEAAPNAPREKKMVSCPPRPRTKRLSKGLETAFMPPNTKSELRSALRSLITMRFMLMTFSYGLYFYSLTTFLLIHVDLARDRDVSRSQGIYLMHLYSVGDVVMRVVVGVIIDRGYLAVHSAMALGHLGNAIAFEALVWSRSTASLLPSAFLLGSSQGIICPLPAPMIIEDFAGRSMPILMGGMYGFMGLLLITMPPLLGYFKDQMGRYDGLLHALAILSGLVTIIGLARAVIKRSSIPPKQSNVHHDSGFCNRYEQCSSCT